MTIVTEKMFGDSKIWMNRTVDKASTIHRNLIFVAYYCPTRSHAVLCKRRPIIGLGARVETKRYGYAVGLEMMAYFLGQPGTCSYSKD